MGLHINAFALTLILLGLLTFCISVVVFRRMGGTVDSFGYVMSAIAIWAVMYGFELCCSTLDQMVFFIRIEYLGIGFLPSLWIIFIIKFIGNERWLNVRSILLILLEPVLTLILVWTNELHHLHYKALSVDNSGPFPLLSITEGPWYRFHTVYFYVMLAWGLYLLISKFRNADAVFKRQNRIILISALIPWFVNLLYLLGLKPFGHLDLTPFAFILTALFIGIGLLRFRLFDIVPIARGKIIDAMQEGVLVIDKQNRIVDANKKMRRLLAPFAIKIVGSKLNTIPFLEDRVTDLVKKERERFEIKLDDEGEEHYFSVTVTSLFDKDTVYSGQILLFRDITERKGNEERLQSLNKLKDRLFSIISHDLRSPLNSFISLLSLANDGQLTADEFRELLPELSKNLGYTSGLVDNLLLWSKSQLQGETIRPVPFDMEKTAEHIVNLFQKNLTEKELTLVNTVSANTIVFADEDMISAVFRNLISNAIKFTRPGGLIRISATNKDQHVVICIQDNGKGMLPEDMDKLFTLETFTTQGTMNEQGTGLGLLLCKDFVEKNKGKIWVTSKIDEGSSFYFSLPRKYAAFFA